MKNNFLFVLVFFVLFSVLFSISFVSSATTLVSPVTGGNYSTTLIFNCTNSGGIEHVKNASLWYNISGNPSLGIRLIEITNTSSNQTEFYNGTISIAGLTDAATYNFTCFLFNGTAAAITSVNSTQITIDNTPPFTTFIGLSFVGWGNYSGVNTINVSANDSLIGMSTVYLNVTNSTGVQRGYVKTSCSGGYCNYSADVDAFTALYGDGVYNFTIYANDSLGNLNKTTVFTVTLDSTAPTGSFTCTPSSVSEGETMTCSCSSSDATSGVETTSYTTNPSTLQTGSFTQTCSITDFAGNSYSLTATYAVNRYYGTPSGGGSSSAVQTWSKSIPINKEQFESSNGYNVQLQSKQRVTLTINEETHHVGIKKIESDKVTIEIASTPIEVVLSVGEETKKDLDDDGFYDLYVKLNSIDGLNADVTIKEINEEVPEEEKESSSISDIGEVISDVSNNFVIYLVIALIVVIAFVFFAKKKK